MVSKSFYINSKFQFFFIIIIIEMHIRINKTMYIT